MDAKKYLVKKIEEKILIKPDLRILDLGSGQSKNFYDLINKYRTVKYVGIEPCKTDAKIAKDLLKDLDNAKIVNNLAYEINEEKESFDLCISLSVLEHIKNLEVFLKNSVEYTKLGGDIIHFYDLGHALFPHSLKEKIQVFLGNNFPLILPENKFVRYVNEEDVKKILISTGVKIEKITYHQMSGHRKLIKLLSGFKDAENILRELLEWEYSVSKYLKNITQEEREKLFPSICIWANKR